MPGYLDEKIPKLLSARRKAFAAARDNPAMLPACWTIVRRIAANIYEYMRNSVVGGCGFPDQPIFLSAEDTAFLNFGTTPRLLALDRAWIEAEAAGHPPPDSADRPDPSPEGQAAVRRRLAGLARLYSPDTADLVYNLEIWIQDIYRDKMNADYAEELQRQIVAVGKRMDDLLESVGRTGLKGKILKGVKNSFRLFKTITGSAHQIDHDKRSFVDRRSFVNTVQKIELVMTKADEALGAAGTGRSVIRELFGLWKDANYENMRLEREARLNWAGTGLDDRIAELAALLGALQKTISRCTEEAPTPEPQLPAVRADGDNDDPATRDDVVQAFRTLTIHDPVTAGNPAVLNRDMRKYGPLVVVLTPGSGQPRYCAEMRKIETDEEEEQGKRHAKKPADETEADAGRRARYPLNCLVTPIGARKAGLLRDMADAWLEYNQIAFPVSFKEFLETAKAAAPRTFTPSQEKEAKDIPTIHARRILAGLVALFAEWARSGNEPSGGEAPEFAPFRDLAVKRLGIPGFVIPLRYRPFLTLFAEAGPVRREEMWKRCLGPRYDLDRQLVAIQIVRKDWRAIRDCLKYLPSATAKGNSSLENGFAKATDTSDPFAEHKALAFFRKFMEDHPALRTAMATVENQVAIEVETLRTQVESLGRTFQFEEASVAMMQRQASQIQESRNAANAHIDQYLTGLMHALDNNLEAAEGALAMCLVPLGRRSRMEPDSPVAGEEIGQEWFDSAFPSRTGKFPRRQAAGEDSPGTMCFDFVYFNLGVVYARLNRPVDAMLCFQYVARGNTDADHLHRQWAETLFKDARARIQG